MNDTVSRIGIDPKYLAKGRFKRMDFRLQALYFCLLRYVDHAGCWDIDLIDLEEDFSPDVTMRDLENLQTAGHITFDDTKTVLMVTNFIDSHYSGKPSVINSKQYPFFKRIEKRKMYVSKDLCKVSFCLSRETPFLIETEPMSNYEPRSKKLIVILFDPINNNKHYLVDISTGKQCLPVIREDIDKIRIEKREEKEGIGGKEKQTFPKSESMEQLKAAMQAEANQKPSGTLYVSHEAKDLAGTSIEELEFEVKQTSQHLNNLTEANRKKAIKRLNEIKAHLKERAACFTVDGRDYKGVKEFLAKEAPVKGDTIESTIRRNDLNPSEVFKSFDTYAAGKEFTDNEHVTNALTLHARSEYNRKTDRANGNAYLKTKTA
jgi:hypothetical protein